MQPVADGWLVLIEEAKASAVDEQMVWVLPSACCVAAGAFPEDVPQ